MAVGRHRRGHIVKPMRAAMATLDRGRAVRRQREEQLAAAEAGDPPAFIALAGIVADLRKVPERLERTADAAEQDGQRLAVSALSAQQLFTVTDEPQPRRRIADKAVARFKDRVRDLTRCHPG